MIFSGRPHERIEAVAVAVEAERAEQARTQRREELPTTLGDLAAERG